jgi:hypothetical protein
MERKRSAAFCNAAEPERVHAGCAASEPSKTFQCSAAGSSSSIEILFHCNFLARCPVYLFASLPTLLAGDGTCIKWEPIIDRAGALRKALRRRKAGRAASMLR